MSGDNWPRLWPNVPSLNVENNDGDAFTGLDGNPIPVVRVVGKPGVGKSMFPLKIIARPPGHPNPPVIVFDYEGSVRSYRTQYAIDYNDMTQWPQEAVERYMKGNPGKPMPDFSPIDSYNAMRAKIASITPGQFAVMSIDPAEDWEDTIAEWLMANPKHFGRTPGQYQDTKGNTLGMFWGDLKRLIKDIILEIMGKGIQTIVLVNHVRQQYQGNKPVPGKFEPRGKDMLRKMSTIEVVLMGDGTKAPAGVITRSRLNITDWSQTDDYGVPLNRPLLPRYMPEFSATALRDYLKNPRTEFTPIESQVIDPWTVALSQQEQMALEAEINAQRIELARAEREKEMRAAKERLIADLIREGYYANIQTLGAAAKELAAKGITYDADPSAFADAMRQKAAENRAQEVNETAFLGLERPEAEPVATE